MNPLVATAVVDSIPNWAKVAIGIGTLALIGGVWYAIDRMYFKEARQARNAQKKSGKKQYWDKNYCEENRNDLTLSASEVANMAIDINNALSVWTNEKRIVAIINKCKNGADWSYVCRAYINKYNSDLYTEFSERLNDNDKKQIFDAVNKLPKK